MKPVSNITNFVISTLLGALVGLTIVILCDGILDKILSYIDNNNIENLISELIKYLFVSMFIGVQYYQIRLGRNKINKKGLFVFLTAGLIAGIGIFYAETGIIADQNNISTINNIITIVSFSFLYLIYYSRGIFVFQPFKSIILKPQFVKKEGGGVHFELNLPSYCLYCSNESTIKSDLNFARQTNIWGQLFTKSKKISNLSIPYCKKHNDENKRNKRILFYSYAIPFIVWALNATIIFIREEAMKIDFIVELFIAHLIGLFISIGIKFLLSPILPSLGAMPVIISGFGYVSKNLALGIKCNLSEQQLTVKVQDPQLISEIEKLNNYNKL
jgi:hypothetical protein